MLISDKEEKERLEEVRKTVSKIAIYATSTDSKMDELYDNQEVLSRFLNMASSENEVVHQCAAYALGNLARSGKNLRLSLMRCGTKRPCRSTLY